MEEPLHNLTTTKSAMMNSTTTLKHPLEDFSKHFFKPAGIVSLAVAIFGVVFNILNIVVLSQPKMRNAVNLLLTLMAVSELLLLIFYIPFVWKEFGKFHVVRCSGNQYADSPH